MGQADLLALHNGLVAHALDQLSKPAAFYPFAVPAAADALVNDLSGRPRAYVIACIMDRQTKTEKAWGDPLRVAATETAGFVRVLISPPEVGGGTGACYAASNQTRLI